MNKSGYNKFLLMDGEVRVVQLLKKFTRKRQKKKELNYC